MKLVLPLGKNKMVSAADFDVEPRFGCACSKEHDKIWLTNRVRVVPGPGVPLPFDCKCQCSYGDENQVANYELGFAANEW